MEAVAGERPGGDGLERWAGARGPGALGPGLDTWLPF